MMRWPTRRRWGDAHLVSSDDILHILPLRNLQISRIGYFRKTAGLEISILIWSQRCKPINKDPVCARRLGLLLRVDSFLQCGELKMHHLEKQEWNVDGGSHVTANEPTMSLRARALDRSLTIGRWLKSITSHPRQNLIINVWKIFCYLVRPILIKYEFTGAYRTEGGIRL